MNALTPYKLQSLVAIVVFTLGLAAQAEDAASVVTLGGKSTESQCMDWAEKLGQSSGKLKNVSPKVKAQYESCSTEIERDGEEAYVESEFEDEEEEESRQQDSCANFKNSCSVLDGVDSSKMMKDAREDSNEANKEMQKAQQEARDNQKKLQRLMSNIQMSVKQAERSFGLQIDAIQKELDAKNKAMDQQLRQAIAQLRKQITEKRNALTAINDSVRESENALAAAKSGWEASCRTEAFQKYNEVKAEIKKLNDDAKTKGTKTNFSSSNVAGASKRKEAKEKRKMQFEYANSFKECVAGVSAAGAAAKSALEGAQKTLASTQASAGEKRETLQKEITDLMSDYADMQTSTLENKDTLRKETESKMAAANVAYQNAMEKANKDYAEAQEDLSDAVQFGNAAVQMATQNAQAAQAEYMSAANLVKCTGSTAMSKTAQEKVLEEIDSYKQAKIDHDAVCEHKDTCIKFEVGKSILNACKASSSSEKEKPSKAKSGSAKANE